MYEADLGVPGAYFDAALGEFVVPCRTVREAEHAEALLLDFLRATYRAGAETGGWPQVDASAEPARSPSSSRGRRQVS